MVTVLLSVALMTAGQAPAGRLHGRVLDPSGAVLTATPVVITSTSGQVFETKTDRKGAYSIDRLPPGDYIVTVAAAGFADVEEPVTIAAGADRALDITLAIAVQRQEIVIQATAGAAEPSSNASATIIKGKDLDALSDDPNELEAQLHALAGPGAGVNSGQIYVDGFTGGKLPPKGAIQEIRINQNPYSAEFDALGTGRIEIITKPGSQTWHGRFLYDANGSTLNSRNPFVSEKPPYHSSYLGGTMSGPLGPKASFTVAGELMDRAETAPVNAAVLDSSLNQARFSQAVPAPRSLVGLNPRIDLQPARNNTLSVRYLFNDEVEHGNGVGQLSLASQAVDVRKTEHDLQMSDLHILSARLLNDARFEYRRSDAVQTAQSTDPQTTVLGGFTGGGSSLGNSRVTSQHVEVHEYVSVSAGAHTLRMGGRLRATSTTDDSRQNFNGTFTFGSLDAYQATERGLQQGWTPGQIRAADGGASQFTIVAGSPTVANTMMDIGVFAQDDWRLLPNVTLSGGLRYETQNDIRLRANVAPRIGVAWSPGRSRNGAAPRWVVRSGIGAFYDRFPQTLVIQAERLDGVRTQQYVVPSPDFYPMVPSPEALSASRLTPTVYRIDPGLTVPLTWQAGVTVEHKMGGTSTVAVGYLYSRGEHQLLSRNLNAPLPGAPAGASPTYQFESAGNFTEHQLTTNFNLHPQSWLSLTGYYVLGSARGNTSGAGSFPSNPFDLAADDGRTTFDVRHRVALFAGMDLPGVRLVPFVTASSGQPFDITLGRDLNGDSIFNDRPAFAGDVSEPGAVLTPFGAFDTTPRPGEAMIPRNFGTAPAQISVNLRVTTPFVVREHDTIRFDVVVSNLVNHVNAAPPVGNLASSLFGQSTALASPLSPSSNRQVHIQLQFLF